MKIKKIIFCGFTQKELEAVRNETGISGEEEFTMDFVKQVSGSVGIGVFTIIHPAGQISMIKAGE